MKVDKKLIYYSFEVMSWLSFIVSSIFLGYFVRDIWNDYKSGKTNDRIYSETRQYYNHPAITVCFEPELNINKLKKYNATDISDFYFGINKKVDQDIPVIPLIDEIRYKIGRDFTLTWLYYDTNGTSTKHTIETSTPLQGKSNSVIVKELPLYNYGICTVIQLNESIKTPKGLYNSVQILVKNGTKENIPYIKIFFTSKDNFYGASLLQWMNGERFSLDIDPHQQKSPYFINLRLAIRKQLKTASNCSTDVGYYKCLSNGYVHNCEIFINTTFQSIFNYRILQVFRSHPDKPCLPVRMSYLNDNNHPIELCNAWIKERIGMEIFTKNVDLISSCKSSCIQTEFMGDSSYAKSNTMPINQSVIFYIFTKDQVQISEQYIMFGVNELIGTIGGHSGLFIGFSFYGFISQILVYFQNHLQ